MANRARTMTMVGAWNVAMTVVMAMARDWD